MCFNRWFSRFGHDGIAYTSCLATERKHQFFKGNKVRNLKNPCLMLARRHEMWACVNDHIQDGSLSPAALSNPPHGKLDSRQTIDDGQIQFLIKNVLNLPFKPLSTLKKFTTSGQEYSQNTIVNVARQCFRLYQRSARSDGFCTMGKDALLSVNCTKSRTTFKICAHSK